MSSERYPLGFEAQEPLDLARASARELRSLPSIGQKRALEIVESRFADGPFTDLSDLERIHGIGPKTVEQVRSALPAPTSEGP